MGDEDGTGASPLSRLEARGVVCDCSSSSGVGLLVWRCCWERVERAGEETAESLVGRPLRRVFAGEDMISRSYEGTVHRRMDQWRTDRGGDGQVTMMIWGWGLGWGQCRGCDGERHILEVGLPGKTNSLLVDPTRSDAPTA